LNKKGSLSKNRHEKRVSSAKGEKRNEMGGRFPCKKKKKDLLSKKEKIELQRTPRLMLGEKGGPLQCSGGTRVPGFRYRKGVSTEKKRKGGGNPNTQKKPSMYIWEILRGKKKNASAKGGSGDSRPPRSAKKKREPTSNLENRPPIEKPPNHLIEEKKGGEERDRGNFSKKEREKSTKPRQKLARKGEGPLQKKKKGKKR